MRGLLRSGRGRLSAIADRQPRGDPSDGKPLVPRPVRWRKGFEAHGTLSHRTMVQPSRFQALQTEMEEHLFERHDELEGLLLALLSRQHLLLVGPKGAAKSMMIRMLAGAIDGATYFERLMTRFTLPDELFGPVSISALKKDRFSRLTRGYLPEANFAFLDEIWKANSSILNSLLALINERLFYNDGEVLQCPLETLMGASAELPQEEALSALYDRFLLRYQVKYIAEDGHLLEMMTDARAPDLKTRLTLDEIHDAREAVAAVELDRPLLESIAKIRRRLGAEGLNLSDRRYKESLTIVRAKAWLHGRTYAVEDDLAVLANILWDDPSSEPMVRGFVLDIANPQEKRAREIADALQVALKNLQSLEGERDRTMAAVEFLSKLRTAKAELQGFRDRMQRRKAETSQIDFLLGETDRYEAQVKRDYLENG
ncbi:MAG: ATPase [Methanobacteriota archaeon]|nr:MAG: ATPase [Euryarchaeota archaeon]